MAAFVGLFYGVRPRRGGVHGSSDANRQDLKKQSVIDKLVSNAMYVSPLLLSWWGGVMV